MSGMWRLSFYNKSRCRSRTAGSQLQAAGIPPVCIGGVSRFSSWGEANFSFIGELSLCRDLDLDVVNSIFLGEQSALVCRDLHERMVLYDSA